MVESKSTALPLGYRALRMSGIILKKEPEGNLFTRGYAPYLAPLLSKTSEALWQV